MFRTLLKKQMTEVLARLTRSGKNSKKQIKAGGMLSVAAIAVLFVVAGGLFGFVAYALCKPLVSLEMGWLYFAMFSLFAVVLGVFGSVFSTYATLYSARDNDLLLSMPIKPVYILASRIVVVYLWGLLYTALVYVPVTIVYFMCGKFSVSALIGSLAMLPVLSVFVLVLSCVLGYAVAKISTRLKNKSFLMVLMSLCFVALYYIVYYQAIERVNDFLNNAVAIGQQIKGDIRPLYWVGSASTGDFLSLGILIFIVGSMLALTVWWMSRSFLKMATTQKGEKKKVYKVRKTRQKSIDSALLRKEFRRYTSSANYMMNCSLGTLFLPVVGVLVLFNANWIQTFLTAMRMSRDSALLVVSAMVCILSSMNTVTAPSVSLEGKHLWIAQSLPVSPWRILKAKLMLHLWLTEPVVVFSAVAVGIAAGLTPFSVVMCTLVAMLFALMMAAVGLALNLKMPNLTWTNENVPVKQSAPVVIMLFGGWGAVGGLAGLYFLAGKHMAAPLFLSVCFLLLAAISTALVLWLQKRGSALFRKL